MNADKPYVYVLIRKDIAFEQQLVQVGHAAWEAGLSFEQPGEVASLIVLEVPDQSALEAASDRLERYGINHKMFFEPDFDMGHSAIATRPVHAKKERHLFRKYPLYTPGSPHA